MIVERTYMLYEYGVLVRAVNVATTAIDWDYIKVYVAADGKVYHRRDCIDGDVEWHLAEATTGAP